MLGVQERQAAPRLELVGAEENHVLEMVDGLLDEAVLGEDRGLGQALLEVEGLGGRNLRDPRARGLHGRRFERPGRLRRRRRWARRRWLELDLLDHAVFVDTVDDRDLVGRLEAVLVNVVELRQAPAEELVRRVALLELQEQPFGGLELIALEVALGERSPQREERLLVVRGPPSPDGQAQHLLVLGQLLEKLLERFLRRAVVPAVEHLPDRREQHFARLAGVAGRHQGISHQSPNSGVLGVDLEHFLGKREGSVRLPHPESGPCQEDLQLHRIRRAVDAKAEELERHRSAASVEQGLANAGEEFTLGRVLLQYVAVQALGLVKLAAVQERVAETVVHIDRGAELAAPQQ